METDHFLPASPRKVLKVHELTAQIRQGLEGLFADVWIEGEVAEPKTPHSGHLYFSLKDASAAIKVVVFRSHLRFLRFRPKAGDSVLIRGRISLYEARGEAQLICDYIEPRGAGALQAAFENLKKALQTEGLFNAARKRPMPIFPARVGLITSPSGAAIQDMLKIIREGRFRCHILLYPVPVQGWGAAEKIAAAIEAMNRYSVESNQRIDLLILSRGGGSLEDLWAFNEEVLARAIARSKIPVLSAVGHESDTTISDYVADIRAPTPSIAAELLVQQGSALVDKLQSMRQQLGDLIGNQIDAARMRVEIVSRPLSAPSRQLVFYGNQVEHLEIRLHQAMHRQFEQRRAALARSREALSHLSPIVQLKDFKRRLQTLREGLFHAGRRNIAQWKLHLQKQVGQLNLLSPLTILGRGYSITRKLPSRALIRSAEEVGKGDELEILLHHGRLICGVKEKWEVADLKPRPGSP